MKSETPPSTWSTLNSYNIPSVWNGGHDIQTIWTALEDIKMNYDDEEPFSNRWNFGRNTSNDTLKEKQMFSKINRDMSVESEEEADGSMQTGQTSNTMSNFNISNTMSNINTSNTMNSLGIKEETVEAHKHISELVERAHALISEIQVESEQNEREVINIERELDALITFANASKKKKLNVTPKLVELHKKYELVTLHASEINRLVIQLHEVLAELKEQNISVFSSTPTITNLDAAKIARERNIIEINNAVNAAKMQMKGEFEREMDEKLANARQEERRDIEGKRIDMDWGIDFGKQKDLYDGARKNQNEVLDDPSWEPITLDRTFGDKVPQRALDFFYGKEEKNAPKSEQYTKLISQFYFD